MTVTMTSNTMMSTTRRRTGTRTRTAIRMPCGFLIVLVVMVVVVVAIASLGQDVVVSARTMTTTAENNGMTSSSPYFFQQNTRQQRLLEDGGVDDNNDADDGDDDDNLNNNDNNNVVDNEYFGYDLADFSLRFERCQYIKMFDADAVEDEYLNDNNPFSIRHFVVFRLCPSDTCSSDCDGVDHGQYVIQADEYLQSTVQRQSERFEEMCNNCQDDCFYQNDDDDDGAAAANEDEGDEENANNNNNNGGGGASSACLSSEGCGRLCYLQDNLEANGYVDAADYLECQAVDMQNYYNTYGYANNNNNNNDADGENNDNDDADGVNDDDGYEFQLYIGPRCSQSGNRVMLGLFYDQYCLTPFTDLKPEKVLGYEISYAMLQHTLATDGSNCLSCKEEEDEEGQQADANNNNNNNNNNADANDRADADNVNEMCEVVYTDAGKCETKYGIEEGFIQTNVYANNGGDRAVNQVENEYRVCAWIESLMLDAYDESGEINLQGDQILIYREVTPLQKTTFSLLFLTVVSLVVAGWFTHRQIEKSSPKIDLSSQTDAVIT